ncbi:DsrE family protein [candidate division KSB1 bacterium]|nr:DsrE family protein [candidate division KSB1 bacterium]
MSNSKIRFSFLLILASIILISGCQQEQGSPSGSTKDGVFIHISNGTNDPHRVLMALNMAAIMAEDRDVLVYFDVKGVEVVLKNAIDLQFGHFTSSMTQIKKLLDKDVQLLVCPGCLKTIGKSEEDVIDGVQIANKDAFFNFTKGRILTLDY